MSKSYWGTGYYEQPDGKQIQRNAALTAQKEKKKGKVLEPVVIHGRSIASSWWGRAWCENLENFPGAEGDQF